MSDSNKLKSNNINYNMNLNNNINVNKINNVDMDNNNDIIVSYANISHNSSSSNRNITDNIIKEKVNDITGVIMVKHDNSSDNNKIDGTIYYIADDIILNANETIVLAVHNDIENLKIIRNSVIEAIKNSTFNQDVEHIKECLAINKHKIGDKVDIFDKFVINPVQSFWLVDLIHILYGSGNIENYNELWVNYYLIRLISETN